VKEDTAAIDKTEPAPASTWMLWAIGLFLMVLAVLFVYLVIQIWPPEPSSEGPVRLLGFIRFQGTGEVRFILLAAFMGLVGSVIQSMTYFAYYVGKRRFQRSWAIWYVLRPFIGMPLALIFYFAVRGGFFSLSAGADAVSPFGVAALCGIVGMFSKQAMDKLQEVFGNLFKTK
jgi:hypothetical protein